MTDAAKIKDTRRKLEAAGVEYCYASYVDVHGVPKAKVVPLASFEKMAAGSELFTVGAMDGMGLVGPEKDECAAVPDLDSLIVLPWDKRFAWFASDLHYHGKPYVNCSRVLLKRRVEAAKRAGFIFNIGVETEFYMFRKGPDGVTPLVDTRFKGPCPAYDVYQTSRATPYIEPLVRYMNELGWGVYSFDQEGGHSQYEMDFAYADALTMSDRLTFFRFMAKTVAAETGAVASFMPKPFANDFRSGAHFNMSLADVRSGKNMFDPKNNPVGALAKRHQIAVPDITFHFTGGLLKHAPALAAVACPTFNSYKGLIAQGDMPDMSWAPVLRCYGRNNRSAMLRLPMNRYCIENRSPDISTNFYLTAALSLAAGLDGMHHRIDPGPPWNDNLYDVERAKGKVARNGHGGDNDARPQRLPRTLIEALDAFEDNSLAERTFGKEFCDIYVRQKTKEWEHGFYRVGVEERAEMLDFV
jgi:glutamine synthetase